MLKLLHRSDPREASFGDSCASLCDRRCGAEAVRRQIEERAFRNYGCRLA